VPVPREVGRASGRDRGHHQPSPLVRRAVVGRREEMGCFQVQCPGELHHIAVEGVSARRAPPVVALANQGMALRRRGERVGRVGGRRGTARAVDSDEELHGGAVSAAAR
jgi:hypothetical protein